MVGIADPRRQYSAGQYQKVAAKICSSILQNTGIPIVVGGTGFYLDTLVGRLSLPTVPPNQKLRVQLRRLTTKQLLAQLKKIDPKSARRVDPNNKVRLVRAVEVAKALGKVPALKNDATYDVLWLGLPNSKNLKAGVEQRLKNGMLAEAKKLRARLSPKRYRELGFEFDLLADYADKKITKKELVTLLANGERKYAKRQMRWFKRNKDILWVKNKTEALRLCKNFLGGPTRNRTSTNGFGDRCSTVKL